ncbi:hypothetical protein J6590_067956 [Homalodisca vitripennis]|nr:hypothetical protein J6590_067956 [Homalodisca vitripennis]
MKVNNKDSAPLLHEPRAEERRERVIGAKIKYSSHWPVLPVYFTPRVFSAVPCIWEETLPGELKCFITLSSNLSWRNLGQYEVMFTSDLSLTGSLYDKDKPNPDLSQGSITTTSQQMSLVMRLNGSS